MGVPYGDPKAGLEATEAARLRAEVERLRNAGWAFLHALNGITVPTEAAAAFTDALSRNQQETI